MMTMMMMMMMMMMNGKKSRYGGKGLWSARTCQKALQA
jgi:hypothetical protein